MPESYDQFILSGLSHFADDNSPADGVTADYPESPRMPSVFVTFTRPGYKAQDGSDKVTLQLQPLSMKLTSSVTAMDELQLVLSDPDYTLINEARDGGFLQEDLKTDVSVSFGYPDTANMSDPVDMVFYKQKPSFPESGPVTTTLVAYDHMIFLTLPFEPSLIEDPKGITVADMVKIVVNEVNKAYGRNIGVKFDGHEFQGKWWRFHKVSKEAVRSPRLRTGTGAFDARGADPTRTRIGTPLEFIYGIAKLAQSTATDAPVEVFCENNALFFRPTNRDRKVIAQFRYFSQVPYERLLSFEPEVALKPTLNKFRTVDQESGDTDESEADNSSEELNRKNLTPKANQVAVRVISVDSGRHYVTVHHGGQSGDPVGRQAQTKPVQKTYKVAKGDNIDAIAKKLGVQAEVLIRTNHLTTDGSTDRAKVQLTPGQALQYALPTPLASVAQAAPNDAASTPKVRTPQQQAQANRAFLTDEYKGVKAKATVVGHPKLKAGWPIYIDNVGDQWEGPWYIEEVTHDLGDHGYTCDLELSRDGFMIGREMADNTGYNAKDDYAQAADIKKQETEAKKATAQRSVNVANGMTVGRGS